MILKLSENMQQNSCITFLGNVPKFSRRLAQELAFQIFTENIKDLSNCDGLFWFLKNQTDFELMDHLRGKIVQSTKVALFLSDFLKPDEQSKFVNESIMSSLVHQVLVTPRSPVGFQEVIFVTHDLKEHNKLIDIWDGKEFKLQGESLFKPSLTNLHGKTLLAAGFDYAPFTTSKPGTTVFDGIEVELELCQHCFKVD